MDPIKLKQPLFMCGMMGSGKSTVGKQLADRLGAPFKDLDSMIEDEAGMIIPEIFSHHGEQWFRDLERKILIRESQTFSGVMALGGGSLHNQWIVDHLKIYGWLIFLRVPLSVILTRVSQNINRPMLKRNSDEDASKREKLSVLLDERLPLYKQAQITIDAGDQDPGSVSEEIIKKLKLYDGFNRR